MSEHAGPTDLKTLAQGLLSWVWQVLAVLILSLGLISMGSHLASEPPSTAEVVRSQHCTYTSVEGGTEQQCKLSYSELPTTSPPN